MNRRVMFWIIGTALLPLAAAGEEPTTNPVAPKTLEGPTFGGKQFWTDELIFHEWRIQQHAWTGHYRLLDEENYRRAWGTYAQCVDRLERLKAEERLQPMQGKVVILLHGLVRSRESMAGIAEYLQQASDYTTVNVSYASTRNSLGQHAASLASVIDNLGPEVTEINFVAHSLGNLVIRHYLADQVREHGRKQADPRIKRIVMLAPPNNGATLAERFRDNRLFQTIWGVSGIELATKWEQLEARLATPPCEFGILAGGKGDPSGNNPLLRGDDDFVVTVDETRLAGATDFGIIETPHSLIMEHPQAREYTLRYLWHGYFVDADQRQPIPTNDGHTE